MCALLSLAVRSRATSKMQALLISDGAEPLLQRLEPLQRIKVLAALMVLLAAAAFLFLVIRAGGRIARWYIGDPLQRPQLPDTDDKRWRRKPRVSKDDRANWQDPEP